MEFVSCDPSNYRAGRTQPVRYIVMHYTANNGDTARNNCDYYHRVGGLQASAHYFCDEHGAMQSVRECDTAWHCGARAYWHPECRNGNSIGIEMCSRKRADGSYYIKPETVANAAALAREIMQRYGIDTEHVVRHYDVTGKRCPMPWVDDPAQWAAFKAMLTTNTDEEDEDMTRYNTIDEVPDWAQDTVRDLMAAGALRGDERGNLNLSLDMIRGLMIGTRYAEASNPRYATVDDVPDWAREDVQRMVDTGALAGEGGGKINLSRDMLRTLVVCQRMMDGK
ncbi:MAG: N-acetylmuramoyl-L-alanine amidase [Clostridiales bacterium]|jgi:N-acetylmuramoyl-L-alanine amidase|nr:MAG: N-acetylmuramoyl-L-alanine amidase [Clostridiales bacterium]